LKRGGIYLVFSYALHFHLQVTLHVFLPFHDQCTLQVAWNTPRIINHISPYPFIFHNYPLVVFLYFFNFNRFNCFLSFVVLVLHFVRFLSILHAILVLVSIETHFYIEFLSFNWWVLFFVVFQSVVLILVAFLFQILCSLCVLEWFRILIQFLKVSLHIPTHITLSNIDPKVKITKLSMITSHMAIGNIKHVAEAIVKAWNRLLSWFWKK